MTEPVRRQLDRIEARIARIEAALAGPPAPAPTPADDDPDAAALTEQLRAWCAENGFPVIAGTVDDAAVAARLGRSVRTLRNRRAEGRELVPSAIYLGRRRTRLLDLAEVELADRDQSGSFGTSCPGRRDGDW